MAIKFKGVDFIEFDSLLTDDERLVRDNTRKFIEENLIPIIEQCNRDGRFPKELIKPMGELGFYGASLQGLRLRRHVGGGVRPDDPGTGARRQRRAFVRQRAVGAVHVSHLRLRQRRAEAEVLAQDGVRRNPRMLWFNRARLRLEPRRHAHPRPQGRQRVHPERREDVDHLGLHRRHRHHLGEGGERRQPDPRLHRGDRPRPASRPPTFTASGRCAPR